MAEGDPIRIIPHRGVDDDCGSLEVWFADGRKSVRFYWDNLVSRRLSLQHPHAKRWHRLSPCALMLNFAASVATVKLLGKGIIFQPFERKGGFIENIEPTRPDHQHGGPKSDIGVVILEAMIVGGG